MLASSKVSAGLGAAALELFRPWDVIYILDFPILAFFFFKKWIQWTIVPFNKRASLRLPLYRLCSFRPTFSSQKLTDPGS